MRRAEEFWQIQLARHSFKKREKIRILQYLLRELPSEARCLELGSAQGAISYFLRQWGGWWVSADLDWPHVVETRRVVGERVVQIDVQGLPFHSESFDVVISLDYIEHIEDDEACLDELARLVKRGGRLIIGTPCTGRGYWLNRLKPRIGLALEHYGHVREGYRPEELRRMLIYRGFEIEEVVTYARFLTELVEMVRNWFYVRKQRKQATQPTLRDGIIAPSTAKDFETLERAFQWYRRVYPFVWGLTRLDYLFLPLRGYAMIISARKLGTPLWARFHEARWPSGVGRESRHTPSTP